jgi:aspartyl protease family protein
VAITAEDAKAIGINLATLEYTKEYSTANGVTRAAPIMLSSIKIGPAVMTEVKAHVNEGNLDVSLLGMSVISRFKSFKIDGDLLILEY